MQGPESYLKKLGIQLPGAVDSSALAVLEPSHRVVVNGQFYWASSSQHTKSLRTSPEAHTAPLRDPVTGEWFKPTSSSPSRDVGEEIFYFINTASAREFDQDRERYQK